MQILNWSRVTT